MNNINLIRLRSKLHDYDKELIQYGDNIIFDINQILFDDDLALIENADNSLFDVVFIESGGSEGEFIKVFDKLHDPLVLFPTMRNNSLPALFEIKTYLANKNFHPFLLIDQISQAAAVLVDIAKIMSTIRNIQGVNLGVIGQPSDWLIASNLNELKIKNRFGINIIDIPIEILKEEIEKYQYCDVPHLDELRKKTRNYKELNKALYVYSALKRICERYNLKGLTIRCFDILKDYNCSACLALSLLNEEGIISSCEGDIPSLLTMYLLSVMTGLPSFMANPSEIDFNKNTVLFAHCTLPYNMANKYQLTTHFESEIGIALKGEMSLGKATICKIAPNLKKEDILCVSGEIIENCSYPNYCRTQIKVSFEEECLFPLIKNNYGNHVIITFAEIENLFPLLLQILENNDSTVKKD